MNHWPKQGVNLRRKWALLGMGCLFTACSHLPYPGETLKFSAWNTEEAARKGVSRAVIFPEQQIPEIQRRENLGIAFFGGGNRAATAALGQLRGLKKIGLLDRARYISSVSGGTWCAAPYCFLQNLNGNKNTGMGGGDGWLEEADEKFLGPYIPPGQLDPEALHPSDRHAQDGSFAGCAAQAHFDLTRLFKERGDKNWAFVLAGVYLKPLHLAHEHRFIAYDLPSAREFIEANKEAGITERDFLFCAPHRPYLLAGATLAMPWHFDPKERYFPLQLTPNYIGTRGMFPLDKQAFLGGGFVESAGYDSIFQDGVTDQTSPGKYRVTGRLLARRWPLNLLSSPRFSLSDLLATSGAAPTVPVPELSWVVGFPEFQHWAPGLLGHGRPGTYEKVHTDGGGTDDSGVAALVARGVRRIICFANADLPLVNNVPQMAGEMNKLFGVDPQDPAHVARIFAERQFDELKQKAQQAWTEQRAPIITSHLTTVENPYFRVKAGMSVTVTWVLLGPPGHFVTDPPSKVDGLRPKGSPDRWYQELNAKSKERIQHQWASRFDHFPYYRTFFENRGGIISLYPEQVNALSQFTTYVVMENREKLLQPD